MINWLEDNIGEVIQESNPCKGLHNYKFIIEAHGWTYVYHHTSQEPSSDMLHLYRYDQNALIFNRDPFSSDFDRADLYEGYYLEIPDDATAVFVKLILS
jgi:hypothetical protein